LKFASALLALYFRPTGEETSADRRARGLRKAMGFFERASLLITLAAIFSFVNFKYIRLPSSIGVMLMALGTATVLIALGRFAEPFRLQAAYFVSGIDFQHTLLDGMLAFLLFAGSLNLDFSALAGEWDSIFILSLLGTALSTVLVGLMCWAGFAALKTPVPAIWCFAFGALISPTDPIAVLAIMRKVGAPRSMEAVMTGESLFNDGIGVVLFLVILGVATGAAPADAMGMLRLLLQRGVGGLAVGWAAGLITYQLLKRVDNYQVEVLLTLALAMGGYTLAAALHVSAPIAIVVAGLFIGNRGRAFAMSEQTRKHLDTFWELIDEVMNSVLFLLIGMELLVLSLEKRYVVAGILGIAIVLASRWLSVSVSLAVTRLWRPGERGRITVLTWGGLRGGLSVAMALALPQGTFRNLILTVTYCIVVFAVFVQGLSASRVIRLAVRARRTHAMPQPT
jgi:CPA1 family monovalent cation:H+ antiporter